MDQEIINLITDYINEIITNEKHFFYQYRESIIRLISEKAIYNYFNEDDMIDLLVAIIKSIKNYSCLLEVFKINKKYNLNK